MGKEHPYYGKSMSTNFPDSPRTIGFLPFSYCGKFMGKSMHFPYDVIG